MKRVFGIVLICALLFAAGSCKKSPSPQVQSAPSSSPAESYHGCVKIFGLAGLIGGASGDIPDIVDYAMDMCDEQADAMRKHYAQKVKETKGLKPTKVSTRLYTPKSEKAIREYYITYFSELKKGE